MGNAEADSRYHARCYANCLGDCRGGISGEHPFSRALLERIEAQPGGIWVRGFPWLKGANKRVGIGSLVANVLCREHNSRLSDLDVAAVSLVELIERKNAKEPGFILETVVGDHLERFLLKMLCGIVASGSVRYRDETSPSSIPDEWVNLLFGRKQFAHRTGLYLPVRLGEVWDDDPNAYAMAPLFLDNGAIAGIRATLRNVPFVLALVRPGPHVEGALTPESMWRPRILKTQHPAGTFMIGFSWSGECTGKPEPGRYW